MLKSNSMGFSVLFVSHLQQSNFTLFNLIGLKKTNKLLLLQVKRQN